MKYEKLISSLASLAIIGGAVMKIMHMEYGNVILLFGFMLMSAYQTWQVAELKKRVKELEGRE